MNWATACSTRCQQWETGCMPGPEISVGVRRTTRHADVENHTPYRLTTSATRSAVSQSPIANVCLPRSAASCLLLMHGGPLERREAVSIRSCLEFPAAFIQKKISVNTVRGRFCIGCTMVLVSDPPGACPPKGTTGATPPVVTPRHRHQSSRQE